MASCHFFLVIFLLIVREMIHEVSAATVYGLINGSGGNDVLVSINIPTGAFTEIAADTDYSYAALAPGISCFDQTDKIFYYVTELALFPVDIGKSEVLPLIKYGNTMVTSCNCNTSNLLVALENSDTDYFWMLLSYPLAPSTGEPKILANLTADNITWTQGQAFDPVHNIFYSIYVTSLGTNARLVLHKVNLDDPSHASQAIFPCLQSVWYLKYDPVQNKLVGIAGNSTTNGSEEFYAFVVEDDGSCTLSTNIQGLFEPSAFTYDPYTATFYIGDVGFLCIFETTTSKNTKIDIAGILNDIEVAY